MAQSGRATAAVVTLSGLGADTLLLVCQVLTRGPMRVKRRAAGCAVQLMGVGVAIGGSVLHFAFSPRAMNGTAREPAPIGYATIGLALVWLGRSIGARSAAEVLESDRRRPVVLFRSFKQDKRAGWTSINPGYALLPGGTDEERLERAVRPLGPMIAIGAPDERTSPVGAARCYLPDSDWQDFALRLIRCSSLVVVRPGESKGLKWELEQIRRTADPTRVVVAILEMEDMLGIPAVNEAWHVELEQPTITSLGGPTFQVFDSEWRVRRLLDAGLFRDHWSPLRKHCLSLTVLPQDAAELQSLREELKRRGG